MKYYRQGDVAIIPISAFPENLTPVDRDNDRVVLAYGEVTGHAHAIAAEDVELFFAPGEASIMAERYLRVGSAGAVLVHEEHAPITLPPGKYEVRHQREYAPAELRQVAD